LEIGAREASGNTVLAVRRDNFEKISLDVKEIKNNVSDLLSNIQNDLFEKSRKQKEELTTEVSSYDEFKKAIEEGKFVRAS
jgi:prolyl-tRNA synthetase